MACGLPQEIKTEMTALRRRRGIRIALSALARRVPDRCVKNSGERSQEQTIGHQQRCSHTGTKSWLSFNRHQNRVSLGHQRNSTGQTRNLSW